MTRHPTARRVHREESAPDDVFVARVLESTAWAKRHSRTLIIGGIIAAVLLLSLFLVLKQRADRRANAARDLTQVRAVALGGEPQAAISQLEAFLAQYDGTPAAGEARLLLGRAYVQAGQYDRARETVQRVARDVDTDMGVNAALLLAAAHENAGEPQRAEELYLRVAGDARFLFQRQDGLDNAARVRLQQGDAAGAAELYRRLVEMTPESSAERQIFELRLGEAVAAEAAGPAAAPAGAAEPGSGASGDGEATPPGGS